MVQNWWPDDIFDYHVVMIVSSASDYSDPIRIDP